MPTGRSTVTFVLVIAGVVGVLGFGLWQLGKRPGGGRSPRPRVETPDTRGEAGTEDAGGESTGETLARADGAASGETAIGELATEERPTGEPATGELPGNDPPRDAHTSPAADAAQADLTTDPEDAPTESLPARLPGQEDPSGVLVEGRVVLGLEGGSEPLPGADMHLWSDQGGLDRVVSDATGRFALSVPNGFDACDTWVQAVVPAGYRLRRDVQDSCDEVGASGLNSRAPRELRFRAERDLRRPLSLLLVDRVTDEIVPHYVLALRRPDGGFERASSDAEGVLTTSLAYPPGPVHYHELDVLVPAKRWATPERTFVHAPSEIDANDAPVRLPIRVGATVRLDLELPDGAAIERLSCRFALDSDRYTGRYLQGALTPLREDEAGVWVRFPPVEILYPWYESERETFWLEVIDSAKRTFATAPLPATHGVQADALALKATALASVWGRVRDAEGEVVGGVDVRLTSTDGAREAWELPRQRTSANGVFSFSGVFPGSYVLRATAREGLAEELLETLGSGEDRELEVALTSVPTRPVRGTVVSETGAFRRRTFVRMRPLDEGRAALTSALAVDWTEDEEGRSVGTFDFGELPEGDYAVSVVPGILRIYEFEPTMHEVTLNADEEAPELGFLVLDENPREEILVIVPEGVESSALRYKIGDTVREEDVYAPASRLLGTLGDEQIHWAYIVPDKRALYGDSSTLHREPGSPFLRVRLNLEPLEDGWSRIIQVVDTDGNGLQSVGVLLDGRPVSSTQIDGGCVVDAQEAPEEITLKHAGLNVVSRTEEGPRIVFVVALR